MKKTALAILGFLIFTGSAYAEVVQGPVQSINTESSTIVVKDSATGMDKTVTVHPKIASTLQQGSVVKVSLKPGTSAADILEVKIG